MRPEAEHNLRAIQGQSVSVQRTVHRHIQAAQGQVASVTLTVSRYATVRALAIGPAYAAHDESLSSDEARLGPIRHSAHDVSLSRDEATFAPRGALGFDPGEIARGGSTHLDLSLGTALAIVALLAETEKAVEEAMAGDPGELVALWLGYIFLAVWLWKQSR